MGRSAGTEGELQGLGGECNNQSMQAGQSETYTDGPYHGLVHPILRHVSASVHRGWVLEHGVWRANLGRGLLSAVRIQPEGTGMRSSANGNAHGGNPDQRNEAPLLSDMQRVGPPLQPLSS